MLNIFSCANCPFYIFFWEITDLSSVACAFGVIERNHCQIKWLLCFLKSFILLSLTRGPMHIYLVLFPDIFGKNEIVAFGDSPDSFTWIMAFGMSDIQNAKISATEQTLNGFLYILFIGQWSKYFYTCNDLFKNIYV